MVYCLILANQIGPSMCINICVYICIFHIFLSFKSIQVGVGGSKRVKELVSSCYGLSCPKHMPLTKAGEQMYTARSLRKSLK